MFKLNRTTAIPAVNALQKELLLLQHINCKKAGHFSQIWVQPGFTGRQAAYIFRATRSIASRLRIESVLTLLDGIPALEALGWLGCFWKIRRGHQVPMRPSKLRDGVGRALRDPRGA